MGIEWGEKGTIVVKNPVGIGKAKDQRITYQTEMGMGKSTPQGVNGGKGQYEVTDSTTTDRDKIFYIVNCHCFY